MVGLKERMAKGFQEIEDKRIVVKYIIVHPEDYDAIVKAFEHTDLDGNFITSDELKVWGAKVVKADVHQKGIIQACSMLIMPESPLNVNQISSTIDISDLS